MSKIIIFEAEHMLGEMYATKLRMMGFEVRYLDHAPGDVVEIVAREKPSIISMDIIMGGGIDGFLATELLKADPRTRDIPLFFLTNLGRRDDIEKGLALGAEDYLIKATHTPNDVVERVREILALPRSHRKPAPPPGEPWHGASVQEQVKHTSKPELGQSIWGRESLRVLVWIFVAILAWALVVFIVLLSV